MFKIAFIGAGSVGFTRKLLSDLLSIEEFHSIEISFMDISQQNLDMVLQLCQKDIKSNGLDIKIHATLDRREALKDAKYIFNVVRIGGLEAFEHDIKIPLKYGVDQCVGDTLCAGGIMYGQRGVSFILDLCKDVRECCVENPLILNYANPNAMMTWAAIKYGKVNTVGLCHGVQGGHNLLANALKIDPKDLDYTCVGINHQTWYTKLSHNGVSVIDKVYDALLADEEIAPKEKVRIDMHKRFGYFSTESNGHLSEYLPWYRKRLEDIESWISMDTWINGETGGYLRVCKEKRNWFEEDFPTWLAEPAFEYTQENRSNEHGSHIVEGLETGRCYRGHFNVINNGTLTNLPDDCIVEVPCYVDAHGISVPKYGDLPLGAAAVISMSIWVQRLSVEAAVAGDITLLRQAMMLDPLVGAVCNPDEVWQMTDEMLLALKEWMPQYDDIYDEIRDRLTNNYITPKYENFKGAAVLKEKSVQELINEKSSINVEDKAFKLDKK